eukprot:GHVU01048510.1.p1 GENE.GHVU01048510.1~~GHVU01048510.1.p1  ORF type:complete len:123 (+),score=6.96 GHVU01048510.1:809-1177(+)
MLLGIGLFGERWRDDADNDSVGAILSRVDRSPCFTWMLLPSLAIGYTGKASSVVFQISANEIGGDGRSNLEGRLTGSDDKVLAIGHSDRACLVPANWLPHGAAAFFHFFLLEYAGIVPEFPL